MIASITVTWLGVLIGVGIVAGALFILRNLRR